MGNIVQKAEEIQNKSKQTKITKLPPKISPKSEIVNAKAPTKIQFYYIHPLSKDSQTIIDDQFIETDDNEVKPQQIQDKKEDIEQIDEEEQIQGKAERISVAWNSFVKIKKKNYLQDYIFVKQIGKGAFGTVSKIKMKYGGLYRAAKMIKSSMVFKQKSNEQKLFAQVSIAMKLDHPNINKLFEVFEWKQQFVLITQLCQGGDLFQRIKNNKNFSQRKVAEIIKQILSGVVYLHNNNIVHRDLKPQNILYDTQSKLLKIIDFGTAVEIKKKKKLKALVGTPYYIAPQVIMGQYDQKFDVWSCGVILYILLCGAPPFSGKSEKEILNNVVTKPLQFSNSIWTKRSKNVINLVSSMLQKNPKNRISALQALNSNWMLDTPNQQFTQMGSEIVTNLKNFHFQNRLKAVVYTYIASQLYSNKDKQILLKAFREIDQDGDGVIGKDQLLTVFNRYSISNLNDTQIEKIIQLIDTNGSGQIDFTQFLVAASNQEELLQKKRLENAFSYLDTDHSGYISIDQVKAFLDQSQQTAGQVKKIFDQVDENGDGMISKKQFMYLLLKKK